MPMNKPPARQAPSEDSEGLRLNKAIAQAGIASRRAADTLILQGKVSVNGELVVEPGTRINPATDSVTVDGNAINIPLSNKKHTYLMLHKPVHVVTTVCDPQGRKTVMDCLPASYRKKRLFPVGRLDYFSEGILLITDDGELTLRLTHPRYHLPKSYLVRVRETPTPAMLQAMCSGMTLAEGEVLAPVELTLVSDPKPAMAITLHQGVNRQIRRMCRDLGLTILTLHRTSFGPLQLDDLPRGSARELTQTELRALKKSVGL